MICYTCHKSLNKSLVFLFCLVKNEICWLQQSLKSYKYLRDFICLHFTWLVIAGQTWLQTHRHHHRWFKIPWHHKLFKFLLILYTVKAPGRSKLLLTNRNEYTSLFLISPWADAHQIRLYSWLVQSWTNSNDFNKWTMSSSHWYIISYNRDITDTSDKSVCYGPAYQQNQTFETFLRKQKQNIINITSVLARSLGKGSRWFQLHPWAPASPEHSAFSSLPWSMGTILAGSDGHQDYK